MRRASETMQLSSEGLMRELFQISLKQLVCELKKAHKKHNLAAERKKKCFLFPSLLVERETGRKTMKRGGEILKHLQILATESSVHNLYLLSKERQF